MTQACLGHNIFFWCCAVILMEQLEHTGTVSSSKCIFKKKKTHTKKPTKMEEKKKSKKKIQYFSSWESFVICFKVDPYSDAAEHCGELPHFRLGAVNWSIWAGKCFLKSFYSTVDVNNLICLSLVNMVGFFFPHEWIVLIFICFHVFICACVFMKHLLSKHFKRNWRRV